MRCYSKFIILLFGFSVVCLLPTSQGRSEISTCYIFSNNVRALSDSFKNQVSSGGVFKLLNAFHIKKNLDAEKVKALEAFADKVYEVTLQIQNASPSSNEFQRRIFDLLQEGQVVATYSTPLLYPILAEIFVRAEAENPPFWAKNNLKISDPEWSDRISTERGRLLSSRERKKEAIKSGSLQNLVKDVLDLLESPAISPYLSGATNYEIAALDVRLKEKTDFFIKRALETNNEGYLKDAANIVAIRQKFGIKEPFPEEIADYVSQARRTPHTDTPTMQLDRTMKAMVQSGPRSIEVWLSQFTERVNAGKAIPADYLPLFAGIIPSRDGSHGMILILRHASSKLHAFFEVEYAEGNRLKLTGKNEAMVSRAKGGLVTEDTKDLYFENSEETEVKNCRGCHRSASPATNSVSEGIIGSDTKWDGVVPQFL